MSLTPSQIAFLEKHIVPGLKAAFSSLLTKAEATIDESGLPLVDGAVDAAAERAEQAWENKQVDSWPKRHRVPVLALRNEGGQATGKRAVAIYNGLTAQINEVDALRQKAVDKRKQAKPRQYVVLIKAEFPGKDDRTDEQTQHYNSLVDELKTIQKTWNSVSVLHERGDYERELGIYEDILKRTERVYGKARLAKFRENTTIEIRQGSFTREGTNEGLLDELGSKGLCQAMVLDFLSGGGSNQTPGQPIGGQMTGQHQNMQNAYGVHDKLSDMFKTKLGKMVLQNTILLERAEMDVPDKETAIKENDEAIEDAKAKIIEIDNDIVPIRSDTANYKKLFDRVDVEYHTAQAQIPRDFEHRDTILTAVNKRRTAAEALYQDWQTYLQLWVDAAQQWRDHLAGLEQSKVDLEQDKQDAIAKVASHLKLVVSLIGTETKLTSDIKALSKRSEDFAGADLPSRMLDGYGITVVPGSQTDKKPGTGDYLTGAEIARELGSHLDRVTAGTTSAMDITVAFDEGAHAIALRVEKPAVVSDDWKIEFFDPNANGYQYKTKAAFLSFVPEFYKTAYSENWKRIRITELQVAETDKTDDIGSLTGPSVAHAWAKDWQRVVDTTASIDRHASLAPKEIEYRYTPLVTKILSVFPTDSSNKFEAADNATQADLMIARVYIERAIEMAAALDREQLAFDALREEVMADIARADEAAREFFSSAVIKHHDGDLAGGTVELQKAKKAIEDANPVPTTDGSRDLIDVVDLDQSDADVITESSAVLDKLRDAMLKGGRMVLVANVDQLAQEMATESNIPKSQAAGMIASNRGRGFTGQTTGNVYVLSGDPATEHDCVHETVHLLSAPKGATKIMANYGESLNEGFTEFFTKKMCAELGVAYAVAYPNQVAFLNRLAPVIGQNVLYRAYMKNEGMDPVLNKLADIWIGKKDTIQKSIYKPPTVRGSDNIDRAKCLEKLKKKFDNFPPTGPMLNFWVQGVLS